jgi:hypothetical protein
MKALYASQLVLFPPESTFWGLALSPPDSNKLNKMKKQFLLLTAALTALTLNSCFQSEWKITLNKDGSGTIVEEITMSDSSLAMISSFGNIEIEGAENDIKKDDPIKEMMSKERTDKRSKELGEGVTFVKAEPVTVGTNKGARYIYHFADINKVRIGANDGSEMMNTEMNTEDEKADDTDKIGFSYKDGVLTVKLPDAKGEKAETAKEEVTDEQLAMMKPMMADMKMSCKLAFEPGIAETNAIHQEKDTITIFEMDMNKIMEKPEGLKKFMTLQNADRAEAIKEANTIPGVKVQTKPEITIKLK